MTTLSLQQQYAPKSICFGCGPANAKGLQLRSYLDGEYIVAHHRVQAHHHAFPGVVNGGIIGTLLDCHCNWASCWLLKQAQALEGIPSTVTAEYTIRLQRPTPMDSELYLKAWAEKAEPPRAIIHGELYADDQLTATCRGLFVAVSAKHPAYHRW